MDWLKSKSSIREVFSNYVNVTYNEEWSANNLDALSLNVTSDTLSIDMEKSKPNENGVTFSNKSKTQTPLVLYFRFKNNFIPKHMAIYGKYRLIEMHLNKEYICNSYSYALSNTVSYSENMVESQRPLSHVSEMPKKSAKPLSEKCVWSVQPDHAEPQPNDFEVSVTFPKHTEPIRIDHIDFRVLETEGQAPVDLQNVRIMHSMMSGLASLMARDRSKAEDLDHIDRLKALNLDLTYMSQREGSSKELTQTEVEDSIVPADSDSDKEDKVALQNASLFQYIDERFELLNQRLDNIVNSLESIEKKL